MSRLILWAALLFFMRMDLAACASKEGKEKNFGATVDLVSKARGGSYGGVRPGPSGPPSDQDHRFDAPSSAEQTITPVLGKSGGGIAADPSIKRPEPSGPAPFVDANNAGFNTLGEYLQNAEALKREQVAASTDLATFRKKMKLLDAEYQQKEQEYARKEQESRNALARLAQNPEGEKGPPAASRTHAPETPFANGPGAPASFPSFSGMPGVQQGSPDLQAAAPPQAPKQVSPAIAEVSAFNGNLGMGRNSAEASPVKQSTIAVVEAKEKNEKTKGRLLLGKTGSGVSKDGKKSLRDLIKDSLARKPASSGATGQGADTSESGSQQAARSALEEMSNLASSSGSGKSDSPLAGYGAGGLKGDGFKMDGSETAAEVARLKGEVQERQAAPEILGKESAGLFERVRVVLVRSLKDGRVSLVRR